MTSVAETAKAHAHRSLSYRPAIDGLRTFAVLSVIVYHGLERAMPGGWFGVDVFFVISGFLITSLLLAEHRRWGTIHLWGFWRARMRRLLPALFVVLATVLVVAAVLTPSGRRHSVGLDALSALFYVANWRFLLGDEAYFAQIASPSPLRHTWSLSVEEQYYLLFPVLIAAILAWSRRRARVATVLAGLAALSALLMASLARPGGDLERVYYGTDTRAHELLIGAVMATVVSKGPDALPVGVRDRVDRAVRVLSIPALLLVLSCFWWATAQQDTLMNGLMTPMCVAVAVVVATAASPRTSPVQRFLAWEPLRRIGLISYGLYLWHWPIMVFLTSQRTGWGTVPTFVVQVALTLAVSYLSYRFVERPVRRGGARALVPRAPRAGLALAAASVPVLVVGALALPAAGRALTPVTSSASDEIVVRVPDYVVGDTTRSVMLIGNSVPEGLANFFPASNYPDLVVSNNTNIGCEPDAADRVIDGVTVRTSEACQTWQKGWADRVSEEKPDTVVFFVSQSMVSDRVVDGRRLAFGTAEYEAYFDTLLTSVKERTVGAGAKNIVLVNVACHELPDFGNEELVRINDDRIVQRLNAMIETWADREDVPVIDQYRLLCSQGYRTRINGTELYGDGMHYTKDSAAIFWSWLAPQLQAVAEGREPATAVDQ